MTYPQLEDVLDLSRDDFKLNETSGLCQTLTVPEYHLPILRQGDRQWQNAQAANAGQQYVRYARFRGLHPVIDLPVPPKLYDSIVPIQDGLQRRHQAALRNEFSHLRYTPVTCDPLEFDTAGFQLRPQLFVRPRQIEICIGVTIYNEDDYLVAATLESLRANIKFLQDPKRPAPWGLNSWHKIVVCLIVDGREIIYARTKALLASLGIYQDAGIQKTYDGKEVVMHLFEYTMHSGIRTHRRGSVEVDHTDIVPCQTILCLKESSRKKANSHEWFLSAICKTINPRVVFLLDAGCQPGLGAVYEMWKPFHSTETLAAATASCSVWAHSRVAFFNMLIGFQAFEYQLTDTLERPIGSLLGRTFAHSKGGLIAYRFSVTRSDDDNIFDDYLVGGRIKVGDDVGKRNVYPVQDRAVSSRLLRTDRKVWRTRFVDSAKAKTDVPVDMAELVLQRKRWINAEFYSSLHDIRQTFSNMRIRPWKTFNLLRILGLSISTLYQCVDELLKFFAIGNSFAIFCVITTSTGHDMFLGSSGRMAALAMSYIYLFTFLVALICALSLAAPQSRLVYLWISLLFIIIYGYFFSMLLYMIIRGSAFLRESFDRSLSDLLTDSLCRDVAWPLVVTLGVWLIAPFVLPRKPNSISSCICYLLFLPVYTNLVTTFAKCNSHDVVPGAGTADVRQSVNMNGEANNRFTISVDTDTGDMIFTGYDTYLARLDDYHEQQERTYMAERESEARVLKPRDILTNASRMHRFVMLLYWLGLNSALVMVVVNVSAISSFTPTAHGGHGLAYVGAVLWAYAGLSSFQLCFTVMYRLSKLLGLPS